MSKERFFTDAEMLENCKLYAMVCLGGMAEGFDYSEAKMLMRYWGEKRKEYNYSGGMARMITAKELKADGCTCRQSVTTADLDPGEMADREEHNREAMS